MCRLLGGPKRDRPSDLRATHKHSWGALASQLPVSLEFFGSWSKPSFLFFCLYTEPLTFLREDYWNSYSLIEGFPFRYDLITFRVRRARIASQRAKVQGIGGSPYSNWVQAGSAAARSTDQQINPKPAPRAPPPPRNSSITNLFFIPALQVNCSTRRVLEVSTDSVDIVGEQSLTTNHSDPRPWISACVVDPKHLHVQPPHNNHNHFVTSQQPALKSQDQWSVDLRVVRHPFKRHGIIQSMTATLI